MPHIRSAAPRRRRSLFVLGLLGLLAIAGCGRYQDTREVYDDTAGERAAAHRDLRTEATGFAVSRLGTPRTTTDASCSARPKSALFGTDTVSCTATRSVAYGFGDVDASPDELWDAERSAVRAVVDDLDRSGWDRTEWGRQLDQSLADRSYDPYPVHNLTDAKDPVSVRLFLLDRRWHESDELYEEAEPFARTLDDGESGAVVVVVFSKSYVSTDCDECAFSEPTTYPTP